MTIDVAKYIEAKAAAGNALLLFQMGDFFEAFDDDTRTIAKVLGLSLTRHGAQDAPPMAGFPRHHLDAYLAKLVAAGHRVALCEQVQHAPKGAKIERHVIPPQADDPFALVNPEPKAEPPSFESTRTKQPRLFSGLDCLPGQQDLFDDLNRRD